MNLSDNLSGEASGTDASADARQGAPVYLGNELQRKAFATVAALEKKIKSMNDAELSSGLATLQSDHYFDEADPGEESFHRYMNDVNIFITRVEEQDKKRLEETLRQEEYDRQHSPEPLWAINRQENYSDTH